MLDDKTIHSFQDFTETERKLAKIWKNVFSLSQQKCEALEKTSSFDDFLSGCATFELFDLKQQIDETFGISINSVAVDALENYSTLCEQAAFIDNLIEYGLFVGFLTDWLRKIF